MRVLNSVVIVISLLVCSSVTSQTLSEKQKEREKNKVDIYSPEEKDNIQMWFYEETKKMGLTEDVRDEYSSRFSDNVFDMRRLNDKDSENSQEEITEKFKKLVEKTNASVKPLLTEEQYEMHVKNFGKLTEAAIKKHETKSYYSRGF